jgi:hypothetical protein
MDNGANILVIDDDPQLLRATARVLQHAGYEVHTAASGGEGLSLAQVHKPDLVLLDVVLPDMDGIEVCEHIKTYPVDTNRPFVVLLSSVQTASDDQAMGLEAGADGYIARPIANRELLARVGAFLRLHSTACTLRETNTELARVNERLERENAQRQRAEDALRESREMYQLLTQLSKDLISLHDADGVYCYASPACTELLGYAPEEVVGHSAYEFFHPEDVERIARHHQETLIQTSLSPVSYRLRRKDGSYVWVETTSRVRLGAESGEVEQIVCVTRDISARKRAEDMMKDRLRFETLLAELSAAFVNMPTADVDRAIEHWLARIVRFLDVERGTLSQFSEDQAELRGTHSYAMPGYEPMHNWHEHTDLPLYMERLRLGEAFAAERLPDELPAEAQAEREYCVQWGIKSHITIPLMVKGVVLGRLGFTAFRAFHAWPDDVVQRLRLIGEVFANALLRKRQEEALIQHAQALERANAQLERFSYVAAHHLQEPLRTMTSFAQLLARRYQRDAETQEYVAFIVQAARQIKHLLRDLLVYTKLDQPMVIQKNVDCEVLVQDGLAQFRTAIVETSATITYDPLPMVNADPGRLDQVFTHLIDNALKFRQEDLPPQIHIAAQKEAGAWRFSIRDNGIGIGIAYRERIFRAFERLHTQEAYAGTGIGLAICKKIVEGHGGQIWMESELGEGTTFYFTIPI